MPKRKDLETVMILGSGPIVIGQACEFDYSATQGCKALKEEGLRLVLLNSNPATVMTDPGLSDRTYIEPMTADVALDIIRLEKPQAILPTLGGQTALNLAMELHEKGALAECGVEMIGADPDVIEIAESRERFRRTMSSLGLDIPVSALAHSVEEAMRVAELTGYPAIIRPSYTLGGTGGGIARSRSEMELMAWKGLNASPVGQVLVEESLVGWKEMELEMIRDLGDNAVIVCGIENVDPMGVHTGDSVTVAPIQTLTDVEYQAMRDEALRVARAVGLNGGCNIQFAVDPRTGRRVVIEMNPRVSRSSALASKATGFPIARVAAKLSVGYRLSELQNGITRKSACFEPALDYCVVKAPRFNFEKFAGASHVLGLEMRAVGETMALGGNYREALQKALRGLENSLLSLEWRPGADEEDMAADPARRLELMKKRLARPEPERLNRLYEALKLGLTRAEAVEITSLDPWFVIQMEMILETERFIEGDFADAVASGRDPDPEDMRRVKAQGFSDAQIARIVNTRKGTLLQAPEITAIRERLGVLPSFRQVDTCAGEFLAETPYYYSSYDAPRPIPPIALPGDGTADSPDPAPSVSVSASVSASAPVSTSSSVSVSASPAASSTVSVSVSASANAEASGKGRRKVMILGGGPNRIGQGIEFDYCCVKACQAFDQMGFDTVMVNSNPETVSTDYDAVGRLYFEPVTLEDVLAVCALERPDGVIVQLGGQTPLNLAMSLKEAGVPIWGTAPEAIFRAEDRRGWNELVEKLSLLQPPGHMAEDEKSALAIADEIGYPVLVRPSFVLGGRAMRIISNSRDLRGYVRSFADSGLTLGPGSPILVDKFLDDAVEVDVDAVADGERVVVAAVMEHIERAGVHSGDSSCCIPPFTLPAEIQSEILRQTRLLGLELGVRGLMNIQYAVREGKVFVLEANPRASRTAPFVAKATGRPLIEAAAEVMAGRSLLECGFLDQAPPEYFAVKEAVIPWGRFSGAEVLLGPEMHSTGEVMGLDRTFGHAFLKAQIAAGTYVPLGGEIILTVCDRDKAALIPLARELADMGFTFHSTPGTVEALRESGMASGILYNINDQRSPSVQEYLRGGKVKMFVNTAQDPQSIRDSSFLRGEAISCGVPIMTTIAGLSAMIEGLKAVKSSRWHISPLQDYRPRGPVRGRPDEAARA
ncbi:MAG: carbamoyl-phosphate synthase large subunit [Deltaproteobacteria bacterium]|jgi:carbamoyl-phosphate synthase large subunit|nr:carbamoyl-phosphate synthase large subunit [Deltaproteobacteria bacterium]